MGSQCTHTKTESMPWWKVDLGAVYYVRKVIIRSVHECCMEGMAQFQVRIGASDDDPMANPLYDIIIAAHVALFCLLVSA